MKQFPIRPTCPTCPTRPTRLLTLCFAITVLLVGAAGSAAQVPPPMGAGPERGGIDVIAADPIEMGEAVLGVPFTADAITETVQKLADGNRIERRTTSTIARDSRGRIRRDQELPAFGPLVPYGDLRIVTISDTAQGVQYLLDPVRKTATRSRPPSGRPGGPPPPGGPPSNARPPLPPRPSMQTETLAAREIAGLKVEGTRTTMTIPAGAIGNIRPVDIITERWYSPELRLVISSRRIDPLSGEVLYRLTNIVRSEPSAELFQVPADYQVTDRPPLRPPR